MNSLIQKLQLEKNTTEAFQNKYKVRTALFSWKTNNNMFSDHESLTKTVQNAGQNNIKQ